MGRHRLALLIALGVDNFGSGLFLPLALVYVTQVVGLPLGTAGTAVAVGTVAGLLIPPAAGRLVDLAGPRPVVIGSQVLQALGCVSYLFAGGVASVVLAAVLLAAGQQAFYSSLFALISDVAGGGPTDRSFALVSMVRSACFGASGLVSGGLLTAAGPVGYRVAVAVDGASFLACAVLLAVLVRTPPPHRETFEEGVSYRLRADRPFLRLIGITALLALSTDFFLTGVPVYSLTELRTQPWVPGAVLVLHTVLTSAGGTLALRATRRWRRTTTLAVAAGFVVLWCAVSAAMVLVTPGWRAVGLLAGTVVIAAGGLMFGTRANAMAVAMAPRRVRGRYLAAFQYAFTIPGVLVPAVVALFDRAIWLPWLVVALCAGLAGYGLLRLPRILPAQAIYPDAHLVRQ